MKRLAFLKHLRTEGADKIADLFTVNANDVGRLSIAFTNGLQRQIVHTGRIGKGSVGLARLVLVGIDRHPLAAIEIVILRIGIDEHGGWHTQTFRASCSFWFRIRVGFGIVVEVVLDPLGKR